MCVCVCVCACACACALVRVRVRVCVCAIWYIRGTSVISNKRVWCLVSWVEIRHEKVVYTCFGWSSLKNTDTSVVLMGRGSTEQLYIQWYIPAFPDTPEMSTPL